MRIVVGPDRSVVIGRTLPGRGAWLCAADDRCLDLALRRKALPRALRTEVGGLEALRSRFPAPSPDARD